MDWNGTPQERLERRLVHLPSDCIEWTGRRNKKGYGQIRVNHRTVTVHRLAWELYVGPIPEGMLVRHFVCDNPPCCNVDHLRLGTEADNTADKVAHGRQWCGGNGNGAKTHCPHGHPYDEANTYIHPTSGGRICRICKRSRA